MLLPQPCQHDSPEPTQLNACYTTTDRQPCNLVNEYWEEGTISLPNSATVRLPSCSCFGVEVNRALSISVSHWSSLEVESLEVYDVSSKLVLLYKCCSCSILSCGVVDCNRWLVVLASSTTQELLRELGTLTMSLLKEYSSHDCVSQSEGEMILSSRSRPPSILSHTACVMNGCCLWLLCLILLFL